MNKASSNTPNQTDEAFLEELFSELTEMGFSELEGLVSVNLCQALRLNIRTLDKQDRLKKAKIGNKKDRQNQSEIRGDFIHWMSRLAPHPAEEEFFERIDLCMQFLSRRLFLALNAYEAHYAVYPKGARYQKHVDAFRNDDSRKISTVLYLNENWQPGDGGELLIYSEKDPNQIVHTVEPKLGKFVIFLSNTIPHEVLPAKKSRYSIAGWMRANSVQEDPLAFIL
jgi:SM-20-related protein